MRNIIFLMGVIFIKLLQRTLYKNLNLTLKKNVAKTLQKVLDKRLGNITFIRNCGSIIELTDKALFLVNMSRTSYLGPRRRVPAKELDFVCNALRMDCERNQSGTLFACMVWKIQTHDLP